MKFYFGYLTIIAILKSIYAMEVLIAQSTDGDSWPASEKLACSSTTFSEYSGKSVSMYGLSKDTNKLITKPFPPHWSVSVRFDLIIYQLESVDKLTFQIQNEPSESVFKENIVGKKICGQSSDDILIMVSKNITHSSSTFAVSFFQQFGEYESNDGYFLKNFFVYADVCDETCASCNGPTKDQCLTCPTNATPNGNSCVCNVGYLSSKYTCVKVCPEGYVPDHTKKICVIDFCDKSICYQCINKKCSKCQTGYTLSDGQCSIPQQCPSSPNGICDSYQKSLTNGKYLLRGLTKKYFSQQDVNNLGIATKGFLGATNYTETGAKISFCNDQSLLGGAYLSGKGAIIQRDFSDLDPHWSILIGYNLYILDTWSSTDASYLIVDNNTVKTTKKALTGGSHICGQNNVVDNLISISQNITHSASNLQIQITNNLDSNPFTKSFGIRNLFILVDYCTENCETCNASGCLKCQQGFYNSKKSCVTECPTGTSTDNTSTCKPCHTSCTTCSKPEDENSCSSCTGDLFLQDTQCLKNCNTSFYKLKESEQSNVCANCHPQCLTCSGNQNNNCLSCKGPTFFYEANIKQCVTSCYSDEYKNTTDQKCTKCDQKCLTCSGGKDTNCLSCSSPLFLDPLAHQCVSQCPSTYKKDSQHNECYKKCDDSCQTCDGAYKNSCLTCSGILFFDGLTNMCVEKCPDGYFGNNYKCTKCDTTCATCSGGSKQNCLSCKGKLYFYKNTCNSTCPVTYNIDEQKNECYQCETTCATCNGRMYDNCLTCQGTRYFDELTKQCVEICPDKYYQGQSNKCTLCETTCATCNGGLYNNCLSCTGKYYFDKQTYTCVQNCPKKFYPEKTSHKCKDCDATCATCEEKDNKCLSCSGTLYLDILTNTCNPQCPKDYNKDSKNNECYKCEPTCGTCNERKFDNCVTCVGERYLDKSTNMCVLKCPHSFFENKDNNECNKCHQTCDSCNGPNDDNCLSCTGSSFLYKKKCGDKCPDFFYKDQSNNECSKCSNDCSKCFGGDSNNCLSCVGALYLNKLTNTCDPTCPKQHYQEDNICKKCDSTCYTCNGEENDKCLSCSGSYYYDKQAKKCVTTCPNGQLKDKQNHECYEKCDSTCATCNGRYNNSCVTCTGTFYLDKLTKTCVENCPDKYYPDKQRHECYLCDSTCASCDGMKNNNCLTCSGELYLYKSKCVSTCPNNYYPNKDFNECQKCDDTCYNCNGPNDDNCLTCTGTLYLYKKQCGQNCPDNYYKNQFKNACSKCSDDCDNCFGGESNKCLSCKGNLFLDQKTNQCIQNCRSGSYEVLNPNQCISCDTSCFTCNGPEPSACLSCQGSLFFNNNQCSQNCPSGQYPNKSNNQCTPCEQSCKTCNNGTSQDCISCDENKFYNIITKECLTKCTSEYQIDEVNKLCFKCNEGCLKCTSNKSCTKCQEDYFLEENSCTKKCKDGFYGKQLTNTCEKCNSQCITCSGRSENECIDRECHHKCRTGCSGPNEEDCTTIKVQYQIIFYIIIFKSSLWISSFVWGIFKDQKTQKFSTIQPEKSEQSEKPEILETEEEFIQMTTRKNQKKVSINVGQTKGTFNNFDQYSNKQQSTNVISLNTFNKKNYERTTMKNRSKIIQSSRIAPSTIPDSPLPLTIQLKKESCDYIETEQNINDQKTLNKLSTRDSIARSAIFSSQQLDMNSHETNQKLKFMIIGNEWISLFRLNDPYVSRPNRTTLIFLKYQAFLFATQYIYGIQYIGICLALGWGVKFLLSKALNLVSSQSKFGNIAVNIAFQGLLCAHVFLWLIPQLMNLFKDKDQKWSLFYVIIFSADVIIFQQMFSVLEYIFTIKYLNCRSEKSFKSSLLMIFKSDTVLRYMNR